MRPVVDVKGSGDVVELGPYRHFMQKEIFEQPRAVADTLDAVPTGEAANLEAVMAADGEARRAALARVPGMTVAAFHP